ncbi:MAG: hypothetical protein WBQ94_06210, partial [Terracidiphilus sp.]
MQIQFAGYAQGESQRLYQEVKENLILPSTGDTDDPFPAKFTQRLQFVCLTALIWEWFRAAYAVVGFNGRRARADSLSQIVFVL